MVKISVYVDDTVWENFKRYVLMKYGKVHGALGEELTRALDAYLSVRMGNMHAKNDNHRCMVIPKRFIILLEYIKEFEEILDIDLIEFIRNRFGKDKRTLNKYLGFAEKFLELRTITNHRRKIYRVKKDKIEEFLGKVREAEASFERCSN